mmetsp:Transcript_23606/g.59875  ORF Transcript_23606/g.59875 Transcript_23606/m.59875 type:complete len:329 (-) Transcript_23606:2134-3120(-)
MRGYTISSANTCPAAYVGEVRCPVTASSEMGHQLERSTKRMSAVEASETRMGTRLFTRLGSIVSTLLAQTTASMRDSAFWRRLSWKIMTECRPGATMYFLSTSWSNGSAAKKVYRACPRAFVLRLYRSSSALTPSGRTSQTCAICMYFCEKCEASSTCLISRSTSTGAPRITTRSPRSSACTSVLDTITSASAPSKESRRPLISPEPPLAGGLGLGRGGLPPTATSAPRAPARGGKDACSARRDAVTGGVGDLTKASRSCSLRAMYTPVMLAVRRVSPRQIIMECSSETARSCSPSSRANTSYSQEARLPTAHCGSAPTISCASAPCR